MIKQINNTEELLEAIGRVVCVICWIFVLMWGYQREDLFRVTFGSLIIFGSYFLMFSRDFYGCKNFRISYIKFLIVLILFLIPILYLLVKELCY